ncbi:MAG: hypothetical protein M0T80_12980 [Actinomycetota bacterium]|nr:hypothetical protein [Actinomycetota bacterium]
MDLRSVVGLLDRETELLVELSYDLAVLGMLARSSDTEFLRRGQDQAEATAEQLRLTGLLRAVRSAAIAESVGLPAGARLGELVEALPEAEAETLRQARLRILRALARAQDVAERTSSVLGQKIAGVREALAAVGADPAGVYGPGGGREATATAQILRRVL